jgi:hypothetical protein
MNDFITTNGEDVNEFIKNYRNSLVEQRDAANKLAAQQRANAGASIMGSANTAGMMYSNLPARSKIRYDTDTYYPALASIQNSYQTGLDTLRANAINTYNQIKSYQEQLSDINEAISDLNKA